MAVFEDFNPGEPAHPDEETNPLITKVFVYSTVAPGYYKNVPCTIRPPVQREGVPGQQQNVGPGPDMNNGVIQESPTCPPRPVSHPNMPNTPEEPYTK